jgi:hypothetical protein
MSTQSQTNRILNYLLNGNSITALSALRKFNCLRLSGRILEIRQKYHVKTEMVNVGTKRIAKYSINL